MHKASARDILDDLKRVRDELGRLPKRIEYCGEKGEPGRGKFSATQIMEVFGSYLTLLNCFQKENPPKKKTKQQKKLEAFEALKKEVEEKRLLVSPPDIFNRILVIGDLHAPYQHPDAISWLLALEQKYKFDLAISVGDEIDFSAISFHDHEPDLLSPGHELEAAIKTLEPLYKAFPKMLIAESNHGSLVFRKAKHYGLPARAIKSYRETIEAPLGWEWLFEIRVQMSNGQKLVVHHSYPGSVLLNSQRIGENLICGHVHTKFSIEYWGNADRIFFAGQTGCLIDEKSLAFAYGKNNILRPRIGSIAIFNGVPVAFPMYLDKHGRWNGVLP